MWSAPHTLHTPFMYSRNAEWGGPLRVPYYTTRQDSPPSPLPHCTFPSNVRGGFDHMIPFYYDVTDVDRLMSCVNASTQFNYKNSWTTYKMNIHLKVPPNRW